MRGGLSVARFNVKKASRLLAHAFWGYDGRGTHGIRVENFDDAIGISLIARNAMSPMVEVVCGPTLTHDDMDALISRLQAARDEVWPA